MAFCYTAAMSYAKPQLAQLLELLPLHDRQSMLDMLGKYPEMATMAAAFFVMKKSGASPEDIQKFEADCLVKIKKIYAV